MTDRARLQALVRQQGWTATCSQTLNPGLRVWTDGDAAVAYRRVRRRPAGSWVRVTAGEPVAPPERLAADRDAFEADAADAGATASSGSASNAQTCSPRVTPGSSWGRNRRGTRRAGAR